MNKFESIFLEHCIRARHTKENCWNLYNHIPREQTHSFQQGEPQQGKGGVRFGVGRPSTHSIGSTSSDSVLQFLLVLLMVVYLGRRLRPSTYSWHILRLLLQLLFLPLHTHVHLSQLFLLLFSLLKLHGLSIQKHPTIWPVCHFFFSSIQNNFGRDKVCIADGSYYSIARHGNIHDTSNLSLPSVLHIPNFTLNLLSISHLTKNLNCDVFFFFLSILIVFSRIWWRGRWLYQGMRMMGSICWHLVHLLFHQ